MVKDFSVQLTMLFLSTHEYWHNLYEVSYNKK